jgi:hypothetical protein
MENNNMENNNMENNNMENNNMENNNMENNNAENNLMDNINKLIQKKQAFLEIKSQHEDKIKEINETINTINMSIYYECGKLGHKYCMELESGMYGETYYICETCGMVN